MDNLGDMLREYTRLANEKSYKQEKINKYIKQELTPRLINISKQGKTSFCITFDKLEFSKEELEMMCDVLRNEGLDAQWYSNMTDADVYHLFINWR